MSYTVPAFNLTADVWEYPDVPTSAVPVFEDVACQLYIASRGLLDITPGVPTEWVPPIQLRMPIAAGSAWIAAWVIECPVGSNRYYRLRWKERQHQGFANEYLLAIVEQCDEDGVSIFRDVGAGGAALLWLLTEDSQPVQDETGIALQPE